MPEEPVTIFISRRFKPGTAETVEQWITDVRTACATFPGFLGAVTLESHGKRTDACNIVFRFSSFTNLRRWEESPERTALYLRLQPLLEEEHSARLSGFEPWFPPGAGERLPSPPKWKIWLMALMAVYPTALLVRLGLGSSLNTLPLFLSVFLACIPISFLMSFFSMPWLTRIFRKWLYPAGK